MMLKDILHDIEIIRKYPLRYIAQVVIQAETPLSISTGEKDLLTDSTVVTDVNGLPMIYGTSLTGVLRHSLQERGIDVDSVFGYQNDRTNDGEGSRLIVSNAHFVDKNSNVIEGLCPVDWNDEFLGKFKELPVRQHAKIWHTGAVNKQEHGKFDEQVVYKGTRFKFELELVGDNSDRQNWTQLLERFSALDFRIGGGSRKGFGKLKIVSIQVKVFDLKSDIGNYLDKTSSLNCSLGSKDVKDEYQNKDNENWHKYTLSIEPDNFWMFGSGFGDSDVDMTPVFEEEIIWKTAGPEFSEKLILIQTSSIKGAISHRVAYHYNKLKRNYADGKSKAELEQLVGEKNLGVKSLFGCSKENEKGNRGNVLFTDLYLKMDENMKPKILNHVAIDRFTGGAINGALFDEKVIFQKNIPMLEFLVKKDAFEEDEVQKSLHNTFHDICNGMLPLGGGVMRGHGCFTGKVYKDGKELINE